MNEVLEAIKSMAKNSYAVVDNEIIDEVGDILYGLGVNYTVVKVSATQSSLVKD